MARITFQKLEDHSTFFWGLLAAHAAVIALGLGAFLYMEHHGHIVTGMNNAIVWGTPHVFAVFLVVAASGAVGACVAVVVQTPMNLYWLYEMAWSSAVYALCGSVVVGVLFRARWAIRGTRVGG